MDWIPFDLASLSSAEVREFFRSAFLVAPEGLPWVWGCAVALGLALCLAGSRATAPVLFGLGFLLTGPTAAELCGRWAALDGVSVQAAFVLGGLVGGGAGLAVYALGLLGTGLLVGALVALIALRLFGFGLTGEAFSLPVLGVVAIALLLRRWLLAVGTGFGGAWIATAALHEGLAGQNGVVRYMDDPSGTLHSHLTTPLLLFGWVALGTVGTLVQVRLAQRERRRERELREAQALLEKSQQRA